MLSTTTRDRVVALVVYAFCLVWLVNTFSIPDTTLPGAPGPRAFPLVVMASLTVFATILLVGTFARKKAVSSPPPTPQPMDLARPVDDEEGEGMCIDPDDLVPDWRQVAASFTVIAAYVVVVDFIGFYVATAVALFVLFKFVLLGNRGWASCLARTAAITLGVYIVFTLLLQLRLPARLLV